MYNSLQDIFRSALPLSKKNQAKIAYVEEIIGADNTKQLTYLYKTSKIDIIYSRQGVSPALFPDKVFPEVRCRSRDKEVVEFVKSVNSEVIKKIQSLSFKEFSATAYERILGCISPNIYGLEYVKQAVLLQLFSSEPVHILLLGDPGTGKTDILRSISELHPITSFGLGSGTSGAGLGVMVKGEEVIKGLLPRANNGICCIDELNLMKREDYAYLYSAMEKGFITYNKADKNLRFEASIRVLATANPKGDKFVGRMVDTLKQQLPFQQALLSRFHIVFLIRKPSTEGFIHITKKIIDDQKSRVNKKDREFIKEYVEYAESISCEFPKEFKEDVVDFVHDLKSREETFLIELSPRIVIGFVRLCKARARLFLRNKVTKEDVDAIRSLVSGSLTLREK